MEKERRYYANLLDVEIRELQGYVKQNRATVERFRTGKTNTSVLEHIEKLLKKIETYELQIEEKTKRAQDIRDGLLDHEISAKTTKNMKTANIKHKETMQIKEQKKNDLDKRKQKSEEYYQKQKQSDRNKRYSEKDFKYQYKYFSKVCDGIPDYIIKKLKNMPHNKGYIWRDIWLFGYKPEEYNQPQIMFERKNKNLMLIHEIDSEKHQIYEKHGSNRKILVKTKYRIVR